MKLAFVRPRTLFVFFLGLGLSLGLGSERARAETAEARAAVMLRDKPSSSGRVVERLPSGAKLNMIEMSNDGAWARVRSKGGKEGWVPVASIRTRKREEAAAAEAGERNEDESLAKRRNVRAEAWVSKSKYHEEDNKMTVVASKAELYGRPQATGTVLGIVRRGEIVQFVRRSADKKWVQIDIGAGELAWVEAKAVRQGGDVGRDEEPPEEPPRRATDREDRRDEEPPPARRRSEPNREEPPPPPSRRRAAEPSPEELRHAERSREEEPPPVTRRRVEREEPVEEAPRRRRQPQEEEPRISSRPKKPPHGGNYVDARVRLGFLKVGQQTRTNGTSTTLLTNYEFSTMHFAVAAQLGYSRAIGKLRLHLDGKYLIGFAGSLLFDPKGDGSVTTQLAALNEEIGGGLAIGGYWDVAGGIDLRLRIGADVWVNQVSASDPPLSISQNILLSMAIGVEFAMPEALFFGGRPFGFRIKGGVLAPGTRKEQPNLLTGPQSTTIGGYVGAEIAYGLLSDVKHGQLFLALGYDLALHFTHFTGQCPATIGDQRVCRDDTVDDANTSNIAHFGSIGLYYQY